MRLLSLLTAMLIVAPPALAANDWPQFRYNETHQGAVPASLNTEFTAFTSKWWSNVSIPGPPGSPAVRENIVYFGDNNGRLWALDQESGGVIWSNTTGTSAIAGAPAVGPDYVYAVNKAGSLYSFNRKTGQVQTGFPQNVGAAESLMFHEDEDLLYIGSETGSVQAYSPGGRYQKWSFAASGTFHGIACSGGSIRSIPVIFENQVMFGSTNGCFYGVNKTSIGTVTSPKWVFRAIDSIRSTPMVDVANKKVIFGDQSGNVYSILVASDRAVTSSPIYTEPTVEGLSAEFQAAATIADGKLIVASRNGNVRALPLTGGLPTWTRSLGGQITSSPAVANGHVLVGSFDRQMYMLKLSDGEIENKWLATDEIQTSPAISGTQGFWGAKDGTLYSFGGKKPDRADLAVQGLSAPNPVQGQSSTISATIKNVGVLPSTATTVRLYIAGKVQPDTNLAALQPGASTSFSTSWTPSATGSMAVRLFADPARTVPESDESNNDVTVTVTVSEPPATPTDGAGATTSEGGIPGFEVLFALLAIGALALSRRRRT